MARIKVKDGGDLGDVLAYLAPITGRQACTGATCAVTLATIAATDVVLTQAEACVTSAYILYNTITAGTGFVTTFSTSPGSATVNYAVFHPNA